MNTVSLIIGMVLLFSSCTTDACRDIPEVSSRVSLDLQRKEKQMFQAKSEIEVMQFLEENPTISRYFFYANEYPDIQTLASRIYGVIQDQYIDTLYRESISTFEDKGEVVMFDLEEALSNLNYYYPNKKTMTVQTMVSGLYNDLFISDSLIVIGIDFFIGEEATYRPVEIPQYILKRYNYDYLAPTVMQFMIRDYAIAGEENTLLSEMIDFGKIYYFLSMLLPCTPDHQVIGFTEREMKDVMANQETVWAYFIQNELLYENSDFTKQKFLGERPNVYEIGEKCPGRIGAWVGWEIVKSYMERSDISMQEMLSLRDHHEIFSGSNYKPQNVN